MENIKEIADEFDEIYLNQKSYKEFYEVSEKEAKKELAKFEKVRLRTLGGDRVAEIFFLDKLSQFLIKKGIDRKKTFIDFENIENNNVRIQFIMILEVFSLRETIKKRKILKQIDDKEVRNILHDNEGRIKEYFKFKNLKIRLMSKYIYSMVYGLEIIDFLAKQDINEIGFIRKDFIYIIIDSKKIRLTFTEFENIEKIINIQKKAVINTNSTYDRKNPILISSRLNSNRIAVAGFDVTSGADEFYFNKRIFNIKKISLIQLMEEFNTLNKEIIEFLKLNQKGKGSFFVTGADMNVGKSTFLLAMVDALPLEYTIGAIDLQNEMRLQKKFKEKNSITLIANNKKNVDECFEYLLKTSRDILVVSEITAPKEVTSLINSALRLNSGICATMHSFSPYEVIVNLRNLMLRTKMYNNREVAETDIARGLDLIIHLARKDERIVVESIDEVVFLGDTYDIEKDLRYLMKKALVKYLNKQDYYLNRLFEFKGEKFVKINNPTRNYKNKIFTSLNDTDRKIYMERYAL